MAKSEIMKSNGFSVALHMPKALPDSKKAHELPPYAPVTAYKVDDYDSAPSNWLRSSKTEASYFVPVKIGCGMWLDCNANFQHAHDVAIVMSIQGINPITGRMTSDLKLERYEDKCPVHGVDLEHERRCPKCKFAWPVQNYISTKSTPNGRLWIDGFRAMDGVVRQWLFTAAESGTGVAAQILGENRVFAIGIGFFKSKRAKPKGASNHGGWNGNQDWTVQQIGGYDWMVHDVALQHKRAVWASTKINNAQYVTSAPGLNAPVTCKTPDSSVYSVPCAPNHLIQTTSLNGFSAATGAMKLMAENPAGSVRGLSATANYCAAVDAGPAEEACLFVQPGQEVMAVNLDVAAGAKIDQKLFEDVEGLAEWDAEPAGIVYVHYTSEEVVRMITANGPNLELQEGFMARLKVGAAALDA